MSDAGADALFEHYFGVYESSWRLFDDVLPCLRASKPDARIFAAAVAKRAASRNRRSSVV